MGTPAFVIVLIAPIIATIAGVAILFVAGGNLTPVGISHSPRYSQISTQWLTAVDYAKLPLIVSPLFPLIIAFTTAPARRRWIPLQPRTRGEKGSRKCA